MLRLWINGATYQDDISIDYSNGKCSSRRMENIGIVWLLTCLCPGHNWLNSLDSESWLSVILL